MEDMRWAWNLFENNQYVLCVCVFLYSSGADITSIFNMAYFFEIWKLN